MSFTKTSFVDEDITASELRLEDTSGGEYVAVVANAATTTYSLTMPAAQSSAGQVLENNGTGALTWVDRKLGDVVGPASSTDNAIPRFDGTTGKLIQNTSGLGISNTFDLIDGNANELINFTTTVGAVNEIGIANAATGDGPIISAESDTDANVNLEFLTRGTGVHIFDSTGANATEIRLYDVAGDDYVGIKPNNTTTSYTLTMPNAVGATGQVLQTTDGAGTLAWATNGEFDDETFKVWDDGDNTKIVQFELSGAATSTTTTLNMVQTANRTLNLPDADDTLVARDTTDTMTNKTLTAPEIDAIHDTVNDLAVLNIVGVASADNAFTMTNSIDGNNLQLSATGTSTNIGIDIDTKGTGILDITGDTLVTGDVKFDTTGTGTSVVTVMTTLNVSQATTRTYTADEVLRRHIIRSGQNSNVTDSLPTAANLVAAMPLTAKVGDTWKITYTNNDNKKITVAVGTGGSIYPSTLVVPEGRSKVLTFLLTNVGGGTEAYTVFTDQESLRQNRDSVDIATTTNGTLATAFANGQTVDGVVLATNDRILIKNQSTATENGVYIVNASGAPTRDSDYQTGLDVSGTFMFVAEGTTNANTFWVCTNLPGLDVVGTDNLTYEQMGNVSCNTTVTDNGIARFDGTTGQLIQDTSGLGINDNFDLIDANANELINFTSNVSAVNEIGITNAATGNGPIISATGDDTNINLELETKGTGVFNFDSTGANSSELRIYDGDGAQYFGIRPATATTTSYTVAMPAAQGAADEILVNDGSGNLTWSVPQIPDFIATATADTSTTSTTYVAMNSMSITPGAGTYIVMFSASAQHSTNNSTSNYAIYNNGTIVAHTERNMTRGNQNTANALHSQAIETIGAGQSFEVYFQTGSGTFTVHERSLIAIRVA